MSGVLDDLAAAAAGVLVSSMCSEGWESGAKRAFVHLYKRAMKQDVSADLEEHRGGVCGGTLPPRDAARIWRDRIREAFTKEIIAADVNRFIRDFRQSDITSCPSCESRVEHRDIYCGECGDVLGAGPTPVSAGFVIPEGNGHAPSLGDLFADLLSSPLPPGPDPDPGPGPDSGPDPDPAPTSPEPAQPPYAQDHIDYRHAHVNGPVIGVQYNNNHYPSSPPALADFWPRLSELRRGAVGIHPVSCFDDEPQLPPYVPRDRDPELDRLVAKGLKEGGLVVVTGEPLAGKTATAWAALERNAGPDTRVFIAHPGTDLRELPAALRGRDRTGTYVVWLDDLERHFDEPALVARPLAQLPHEGVLVLATMPDAAYDTHRFGKDQTARALRGARTVDLTCEWSKAELARLSEERDPRLKGAFRWRMFLGVTRFLSVGPDLWEEWRRASRPGGRATAHLLVRAAIDAARCGAITSGLSEETWDFLINVRQIYGSDVRLELPLRQEDLDWAKRPRLGVCGLLVPGDEEGTWRAAAPLVEDTTRCPDSPPLTLSVWEAVAWMTKLYRLPDRHRVFCRALRTVQHWAETGEDPAAPALLATLSTWLGDGSEAEHWWRRVGEADASQAHMLGRYLLLEKGELTKALPYIQTAAEAGNPDPAQELGFLLLVRALHWLGVAAEQGNASAAQLLPALRTALKDEKLQAALAHPGATDLTTPVIPDPALTAEHAIHRALDILLDRAPATPPDTVKE
ncbi:hypothetical protein GA0115233_102972 [Streptomyces sp. DI166]|nr:hypothetical protein GA0115233_102972 [Streptomyces sp. DI166]